MEEPLLKSSPLTSPLAKPEPSFDGKSTGFQVGINILNVLVGFGILSLPYAFKLSGWVFGVIYLTYFCLYTNYTAKLIGKIMTHHNELRSLPDIAEKALGSRGRFLATLLLTAELVFADAILLTIMSDHLHAVFPHKSSNFWTILVTGLLYPTCLTDKVHYLSYLSFLSVITMYYICFILLITAFIPSSDERSNAYSINWSNFDAFGSITGIVYTLGIHMVGYAGHATLPVIYNSMKDKTSYDRIVNLVYLVVFSIYITFSVLGYLIYYPDIEEEITINIYNEARHNVLVQLCAAAIILNPTSKFAFTTNTVALVFEEKLVDSAHYRLGSIVIRTSIVVTSLLINLFMPSFVFLCALIGAVTSYMMSGILPSVYFLKLCEHSVAEWYFNLGLIIVNSFLCVAATIAVFWEL